MLSSQTDTLIKQMMYQQEQSISLKDFFFIVIQIR